MMGVSRLLEQEARIVGIKGFSSPTLEAVDRRRSQLWTVAFSGLVCLAAAVALLTSGAAHHLGFANGLGFRIGTVVLVVGLAVYVTEKERHLRRLSKLLVDERVLGAALSNRLKELAMLYEAGKAMNSVLVVDEVLQLILSSAFELLGASSGSIMLLQDEGDLVVVCRAGNANGAPIELGGGIASRVARDREPLLVQGTVSEKGHQETESAVCVPLLHRSQVLGVINLIGATGHTYSEYDLRAVSLFAEHAAIAVANARLYEAERALSAQLSHQVVHDPLTGAANRVLLSDRLGHALARVRRKETSVAVLFIDVDNFKLVNDELGHETGDFVLTAIAQRLAECVRPVDTVGRFGGDEFLVICEDLTHDGQGAEIAERILEGLTRPFATPFGERMISASIGVAPCGHGRPESVANLIRAADQAMYRAKMEGKARIVSALTRAPGPA
jgi:diguanylate cyclase (GGDEF)-like protein